MLCARKIMYSCDIWDLLAVLTITMILPFKPKLLFAVSQSACASEAILCRQIWLKDQRHIGTYQSLFFHCPRKLEGHHPNSERSP